MKRRKVYVVGFVPGSQESEDSGGFEIFSRPAAALSAFRARVERDPAMAFDYVLRTLYVPADATDEQARAYIDARPLLWTCEEAGDEEWDPEEPKARPVWTPAAPVDASYWEACERFGAHSILGDEKAGIWVVVAICDEHSTDLDPDDNRPCPRLEYQVSNGPAGKRTSSRDFDSFA